MVLLGLGPRRMFELRGSQPYVECAVLTLLPYRIRKQMLRANIN
jgi:hypothetical protein